MIVLGILSLIIIGLLPVLNSESHEVSRSRPKTILMVVSTSPLNASTDVPIDMEVTITFNMAINVTIFPEGFQISPSVNGTFTWSNENKTVSFTPNADLDDYTQYQVTIDRNYVQSDDGVFTLEDDHTWSFTTGHFHPFILTLGPYTSEDGKVVEGAEVTIIINGIEYRNLTNATGIATIHLPEQPPEAEYEVIVAKEGYESLFYIIEINEYGEGSPPPVLKEKEKPPSFIPGFETIAFLTGLALLLIIIRKRK